MSNPSAFNDEQVARASQRYGWTPDWRANTCPRTLAGKRCRIGYPYSARYGSQCICQRYPYSQLMDHPRRWKDADGRPILTYEPYGIDARALVDFTLEANAELDLKVSVLEYSPYFPERTTAVLVERA